MSRLRFAAFQVFAAALLCAGSVEARCGRPVSDGSSPTATDCLFILRTAVGSSSCDLCVCDVDDSGSVVATDALRCLRRAVGQNVTLTCPSCSQTLPLFDHAYISGLSTDDSFQQVGTDIEIPPGPFADARLLVDFDSGCHPFQEPVGNPWPDDCDTFNRYFEITLDPPADEDDPPGLVVMMGSTPFGGDMHVERDVTDLVNGLPGTREVSVFVPTLPAGGAKGGYYVTATLELTPGSPPRDVVAVLPLIQDPFVADSPIQAGFTTPEGISSARLEYQAMGFGNASNQDNDDCIGPAEEFCRRTHHLRIDEEQVQEAPLRPWRDDCDERCTLQQHQSPMFSYCEENPTGIIASATAPRANWCPADAAAPISWFVPAATEAGQHQLEVFIDEVAPGGHWRVAATLYLFDD